MKTTYLIVVVCFLSTIVVQAQSDTLSAQQCDVLIYQDNRIQKVNILSESAERITYLGCCDGCNVSTSVNKIKIKTILYGESPTFHQDVMEVYKNSGYDSTGKLAASRLSFTKKSGRGPTLDLKNGSRTKIWTNDGEKIKGRFYIVDSNTVKIDGQMVALNDVKKFTKPVIFSNVAGAVGIIGGTIIGGIIMDEFLSGFFFVAPTFIPALLHKKKLRLNTKWNVSVKMPE